MPLSIEMYATEEKKEIVEAAKATTGQFSVDAYIADSANAPKYEILKTEMAAREERLKGVADYSARMEAAVRANNTTEIEKIKAEYTGLYTEIATSLKNFYAGTLVYIKNPNGTLEVYAKQITADKAEYVRLGTAPEAEQITYTALIAKLDADMQQEMTTLMNTLKQEEDEIAAELPKAPVDPSKMGFGDRLSAAWNSLLGGDIDGALNVIKPSFTGMFAGIGGMGLGLAASSNGTFKQIGTFIQGMVSKAAEALSSLGIPGLEKYIKPEAAPEIKNGPIVYPEELKSEKNLELNMDNILMGKVRQGATADQLATATGITTYADLLGKYKKYMEGNTKEPKDFFSIMNDSFTAIESSAIVQAKVKPQPQLRSGLLAIAAYTSNYGKEQTKGQDNVYELAANTQWPGATQEITEGTNKKIFRAYPEGGHLQSLMDYLAIVSARAAQETPAWATPEAMITGLYPGDVNKDARTQIMKIISDNALTSLDKPIVV